MRASSQPDFCFWFEAAIPAFLAVAAAICWVVPDKFPSIVFVMCSLSFVFRDPLLQVLSRPVSRHISESVTETVEGLFRNEKQFDRLLMAGTDALEQTMASAPLRSSLKMAIVESVQNEDLLDAVLATTTNAIVKASKDDSMREALTVVSKTGVLEALRDEEFMKDIVASLVAAILSASKDPELKTAMLEIGTDAVSTALQDEKFVAVFRGVVKDSLRDGEMYRAGASGLIGAIMPRMSGSSNKKV